MTLSIALWMGLFWGMQVVAHLLFKWGSLSSSRWLWGFFGGHLFGVSSLWIMMILYRTMNPNVVLGICVGGMFLLSQVAIAVVYRSSIAPVQVVGIAAITVGIVLMAVGGRVVPG